MLLKQTGRIIKKTLVVLLCFAMVCCIYLYASGNVFFLELAAPPLSNGSMMRLSYKIEKPLNSANYTWDNKCTLALDYVTYFNDYMAKHNCYADSRTGKGVTCNVTYAEYIKEHRCTPPSATDERLFVLKLDANDVGVFDRIDYGDSLGNNEKWVRYYTRGEIAFIEPQETSLGRIRAAALERAAYAIVMRNIFSRELTLLGYADAELKPILQ